MTKALTTEDSNALTATELVRTHVRIPAVDVGENEEDYLILADIPGLKHEDIEVQVDEVEVKIRALLPYSRGANENLSPKIIEFKRSLNVEGCGINREGVVADYENGVLSIRLPKIDKLRPRHIKIKKTE